MEHHLRDCLVSRIISGYIQVTMKGRHCILGAPSAFQAYLANEQYIQKLEESQSSGMLSKSELYSILADRGMWSPEQDERLGYLSKEMESCKVDMFQSYFNSIRVKQLKSQLQLFRNEYNKLYEAKHQYDYITDSGFASFYRLLYLLGLSLKGEDLRPLWNNDQFLEEDDDVVPSLIEIYRKYIILESEYRELARTEPWRSLWSAGKNGDLFGGPLNQWTDEQRNLVLWSKMYDSVYESSDCPADEVICDDDMMDGWMIFKNRERSRAQKETGLQKSISSNPKIANAQEVFVVNAAPNSPMGLSSEDASRVYELNNPEARSVIKGREMAMEAMGRVDYKNLPDKKLEIMAQAQQAAANFRKGGK